MAQDGEQDSREPRTALVRRVWFRSTVIATLGAFLGGVAVIGAQYVMLTISAGYPPFVQSVRCELPGQAGGLPESEVPAVAVFGAGAVTAGLPDNVGPQMLPSVVAGATVSCTVDAPGADYAAWTLGGPRPEYRAGPLDPDAACQAGEAFRRQDARGLMVATCQTFSLAVPGLHVLSVKVMSRGIPTVDRGQLTILVRPAPPPAPAAQRIRVTVVTAPNTSVVERRESIAQSQAEHGVLPTDRSYTRVVYRLAPAERFLDAHFEPRSAAHASAVRIALDPGGSTVTARFSLRSGPFVDRYRGWVNGDAVVRVEASVPGTETDLPEADLPVPGRVTLPLPADLAAAAITRLRVLRPDAGTRAEGLPGAPIVLDGAVLTARSTAEGLEIEAAPR